MHWALSLYSFPWFMYAQSDAFFGKIYRSASFFSYTETEEEVSLVRVPTRAQLVLPLGGLEEFRFLA